MTIQKIILMELINKNLALLQYSIPCKLIFHRFLDTGEMIKFYKPTCEQ